MDQLSDWIKMAGLVVALLLLLFLAQRMRLFRMCLNRFIKSHDPDIVAAQISSIRRHSMATGLNAGGLALGIILVFYGGDIGQWVVYSGVSIVFLSIAFYLAFEWLACRDDEQVVQLIKGEDDAKETRLLGAIKSINIHDVTVVAEMPEKLVLEKDCMRFVYPSTRVSANADHN